MTKFERSENVRASNGDCYRTPDRIFINMRVFFALSQETGDRRQEGRCGEK
ncbi:MAG: hypothetical protein F6K18_31545 [Okeania sp. SIO2C2]|uniref:hypothetical protein n=1 Tax=Okeania sp. SIO2C2 TaxID=2607787 RepID=UPI0013BAC4D3|nr:hypothetical protein [Okeania sp. SIO2C2]NEP90986.1 hypothetical protein [Okeania sp. SIO2C2]